MQYNKIYKAILLATGIFLCSPLPILGSTTTHPDESTYFQRTTLRGIVRGSGKPLAAVTVSIGKPAQQVKTDKEGRFIFPNLPKGRYELTVRAVGYKPYSVSVELSGRDTEDLAVDLQLDEQQIEDVLVHGRTRVQEINRQAYNVTALDATKLYNSTLDIGHAIDRMSGIRVRESGGVGSDMNIAINGFSGKQIKIFIDGVPMDGFGSSFQLNNIPVNIAERVEVYRGVVPVWLGADAMGGAINIVTNTRKRSYLDASYSYGSFNTHRSNINAGWTGKSGFTVQVNAYQNYSDNNYRMWINPSNVNTWNREGWQYIRRFHDTYHNEVLMANVGVVDKKYADRLMVGIQVGKTYQEIQTGAQIESVFGHAHRRGNIIMPTLRYQKKDLFVKGLTATLNANINVGKEQNIDTMNVRYDWLQNAKYNDAPGGERSYTLYKYSDNTGLATATLSYDINERHAIVLNNVFTNFDRRGSDELYPENEKYELPSRTRKNMTGIDYRYNHDGKWVASVFFKNYHQKLEYTSSYNPSGNWGDVDYEVQKMNYNKVGYGVAASYFVHPDLQLKASYENAKRMPEAFEIFGDMVNRVSNLGLKPESSDNFNAGVSYFFHTTPEHRFALNAGWLYRNARDFIRERLQTNQTQYVMENLAGVTNMGIDGELRYSYRNLISAGASLSYHNFRNNTKYDTPTSTGISLVYRDRMPNIPYLYGNMDASVFLSDLGRKGNNLTIGYNLLYVNEMYLFWPSQGSEGKNVIPTQVAHDVNLVYSLSNGKYNVGLECKNLTDARLYDNFSLPKPSRGFFLKMRYFLSN